MKQYDQIKQTLLNEFDPMNKVRPSVYLRDGVQQYYIERRIGDRCFMMDSNQEFIELRKLNKNKEGWKLIQRIYPNKIESFS